MTADEIASLLNRIERAAMAYERLGKLTRDDEKTRQIRKETIAELADARRELAARIRALAPSPPLVDQGGQERVEDRLDEPEHRTSVHDAVRGVDEHPSAVDTDKARGGVLDMDFGHGKDTPWAGASVCGRLFFRLARIAVRLCAVVKVRILTRPVIIFTRDHGLPLFRLMRAIGTF